jgi:hypothetical protein
MDISIDPQTQQTQFVLCLILFGGLVLTRGYELEKELVESLYKLVGYCYDVCNHFSAFKSFSVFSDLAYHSQIVI